MSSATDHETGADLCIGLMSGTSLDGVDAVLANARSRDLAFSHRAFPADLRQELLALNRPGANELHRAAVAGNGVSHAYALAVADVLAQAGLAAANIRALGAHGQTVRHQPQRLPDGTNGYTIQLINGALLAELTGIDVVCDFRSRDVAAGGQGAPLVPAFHAACFARPGQDIAVLNLGGIANLSLLPAGGPVTGFDCGPGNVLMDLWCQQTKGLPYDAAGAWAATGRVQADLLQIALAEPYFGLASPKSTGRDLFDEAWVQRWLAGRTRKAEDVAATLAELTAATAVQSLQGAMPAPSRLLVCGGGAYNTHLMVRLQALLGSATPVHSTAAAGMSPERVEALAFAWLARACVDGRRSSLPEVTGARGARVLGAIYPAG